MNKKRIGTILIMALLVAAGGGWYYYDQYLPAQAAPPVETIETAQVYRGDLVITASGTGTLVPATEVDLGFRTSGVLTEVSVDVGDWVEAGDVLARLDDSDAQAQVTQAEINLRLAELQLAELTGSGSEAAEVDPAALASAQAQVTQAEMDLADAKENLDLVKSGPTEAQLATAEATLKTAEENYEELLARPDTEAVRQAELQLSQARNSLWSAQVSRDSTCGASARGDAPKSSCETANASVANAEIAVQLAEISYQQAQTPATAAEITNAAATVQRAEEDLDELRNSPSSLELTQAEGRVTQAEYNLAQAQAQLDDLLAGASADDLESAQLNVEQARSSLTSAQAQLDDLLAGASAEDLESAQLNVEQARSSLTSAQAQLDDLLAGASSEDLEAAQLNVEQARNNLTSAQEQVEDTVLRAPFAGTALTVNAQPSEAVGTGAIITVADLETPQVLFWVEESDLMSVAPGNAVNIVFEALPEYTFPGEILHVDPALVTVDGTPAVQSWASVDLTAHPVNLLSGMNAEVEIIAGEAKGAVLVPIQALREVAPDQYAVFVVQPDEELELRMVEVGLKDYVNAEILSGLEVGEVVSTGTVESLDTSSELPTGGDEQAPPADGMMRMLGG